MHFKGSYDNFPFSSNRYETTYGSSYNRSYNFPNKQSQMKLNDVNINSNISQKKSKFGTNINLTNQLHNDKLIVENVNQSFNSLQTTGNKMILDKTSQASNTTFKSKTIDNSVIMDKGVVKQYDYNHMVTQIAKITDNLFLSGLYAINNERLKCLGITLVVSLIAENSIMKLPSAIQRLQVNIEDMESANIRRHFESVLERMNLEERRHGKILVHCVAGISRSSTIVLAYLMRYNNLRLRQAYDLVHSQRPYIQPNLGFWRQLIDYEKSIFGSSTVNLIPMEGTRNLVPDVVPSILPEIISFAPMMRTQQRTPFLFYPSQ